MNTAKTGLAQIATRSRDQHRGQVIVIFAGAMLLLMMMTALVVDVSWYWVNSLRVQRAADAAALAGAVMLPNQPGTATTLALAEAKKNGYPVGADVTITVTPDDGNRRRLNVTIQASAGTFFMRVLGIESIPIVRTARAEFTLPVPMGSPQNYYGVGVLNIPTEKTVSETTGWSSAGGQSGNWDDANAADADIDASGPESKWARSPVNGSDQSADDPRQQWLEFGLDQNPNAIPDDNDLEILGIEVRSRAFLQGSGDATDGCRMSVQLSWDNGNSWTTAQQSGQLPTDGPPTSPPGSTVPYNVHLGGPDDTWGHAWTYEDITDAGDNSFRVRVTFANTSACSNTRRLAIDTLEARVSFRWTDLGPPEPVQVRDPYNVAIPVPQKFWGAMQSEGAPSIQGDAYMTGYANRKSATNDNYDPERFYNYGIEMPGTNGEVWIFDPGFCDTSITNGLNQGTGEGWTISENNTGGNGSNPAHPVSAQYNLFDDNNTPYEYGDDILVGSSDDTFRRLMLSDPNLGGGSGSDYPGVESCAKASWHNKWWRLPTNTTIGSKRYRLQTTSRIFADPEEGTLDLTDDQRDSTGLNAFAIWTRDNGSAAEQPRVYGLGAMEAYFPLPGDHTSEFYLAQIEAVHAGKWMDIDLWDPGDTGSLKATLRIVRPDGGSGTISDFYWNAVSGTSIPGNFTCGPSTSDAVSSIVTNTGGSSVFNGRWLRICIKLPDDYSAPTDPVSGEDGWWKIRYQMEDSGASTDLTTWQVTIRGNPVHLVLPGE